MLGETHEVLRRMLDVKLLIDTFDTEVLKKVGIHRSRKEVGGDIILLKEAIWEVEYGLGCEVQELPGGALDKRLLRFRFSCEWDFEFGANEAQTPLSNCQQKRQGIIFQASS